nr:HAD hydrolase-like protein [Pseudodesulfovibrio sp. JC047]
MDGTLAHSFSANAKAYAKAFTELGCSFVPEEYCDYVGKSWNEWGPKRSGTPEVAQAVHRRKKDLYPHFIPLISLVREGYDLWTQFHGIVPCWLVTNASKSNAHLVLEHLELTFDAEFFGEDFEDNDQLLRAVVDSSGLAPEQILLVDDGVERINSARQLGIRTHRVRAETDFCSR